MISRKMMTKKFVQKLRIRKNGFKKDLRARKQSYDVLTWSLNNVFAIFAEIASKQTDFSQKWDLYMNDDRYKRNALSLSYNYLY